jgi:hypothetical protein
LLRRCEIACDDAALHSGRPVRAGIANRSAGATRRVTRTEPSASSATPGRPPPISRSMHSKSRPARANSVAPRRKSIRPSLGLSIWASKLLYRLGAFCVRALATHSRPRTIEEHSWRDSHSAGMSARGSAWAVPRVEIPAFPGQRCIYYFTPSRAVVPARPSHARARRPDRHGRSAHRIGHCAPNDASVCQ